MQVWNWWLMQLLLSTMLLILQSSVMMIWPILAFSEEWSSKESSNLQPEYQWPRTLKGKNRERIHLSKCSRTNISFRSISQGPHPSLHYFLNLVAQSVQNTALQNQIFSNWRFITVPWSRKIGLSLAVDRFPVIHLSSTMSRNLLTTTRICWFRLVVTERLVTL